MSKVALPESRTQAHGGEPLPDRPHIRAFSGVFLTIQGALLINQGLFTVGLPALSIKAAIPGFPFGVSTGLIVMGYVSVAYLLLAATSSDLGTPVKLVSGGSLGLTLPGLFSSLVHSDGNASREFALAVISLAIVIASALAGIDFLVKLLFIGGGVWGWVSVGLGVATTAGALNVAALEVDTSGRYGEWLAIFLPAGVEQVGALTGLAVGRQPLGAAAAVILILQIGVLVLRRQRHTRNPRWFVVSTVGVAACLAWSLSRTGIIAAILGVIVLWSARFLRSGRAFRVATAGATVAVLLMPLVALFFVRLDGIPTTTFEWRLALWEGILSSPASFSYFGAGPSATFPLGAGHAHNLFLEMIGTGGLVGLLGFATAVICVAAAISRMEPPIRGLALAAWLTFVACGQFEVPYTPRSFAIPAVWFVILSALGGLASFRLERDTPLMPPKSTVTTATDAPHTVIE